MKKFLLSIVAILCAAFAANAGTKTVTFDFENNAYELGARLSGSTDQYPANDKDFVDAATGVRIITSGGNLRLWSDGLRMYKGTSITFKAPQGYAVNSGNFTCKKAGDINSFSATLAEDKTSYTVKYNPTSGGKGLQTVTLELEELAQFPTSCGAPVYTVVGFETGANSYETFAGKTVSIACPTAGATFNWTVSVNGGAAANVEGVEYVIPADATAGTEFKFNGYAEVQGAEGMLKSESTQVTVTVVETKGVKENPYTVADILNKKYLDAQNIWVKGFIIGEFVNNGKKLNAGDATFESTNIVLADTKDGFAHDDALEGKAIPVELPDVKLPDSEDYLRAKLGLFANPSHLGKEVLVHANAENYFTLPGLKGTKDFELINPGPDTGVADVLDGSNGPVRYYDVNGRAVAADAKGILIKVQGGKAVKVFNK